MRLRIALMIVGALLVVATYTFPYWQPIIQPESVVEEIAFPGLPLDLQDDFLSLPPEIQRGYQTLRETEPELAVDMVTAALAPRFPLPEEDTEMPEMTAPVIVASGTFERVDVIRWGQGTLNLYQTADGEQIMRFDDNFSVANGPDLRVFLSPVEEPTTTETLQSDGGALEIGTLRNSFGAQNYTLPEATDLSQYRSVVIYSPNLDMIYTFAPLFMRLS